MAYAHEQDMFIDAVSDLITKIEDPKVKPAIKEELKKELRDLDTKGEIQAFVKGRGPRPDLSSRITESMYVWNLCVTTTVLLSR